MMSELLARALDCFYSGTSISADGTWVLEEDRMLRKAWHGYDRVVAVETDLDPDAGWMVYHELPEMDEQIEVLDERLPRDAAFHEAEKYMTEVCWSVHADFEVTEITQADVQHLGG